MKTVLKALLFMTFTVCISCDSKEKDIVEWQAQRALSIENVNPAGTFPIVKEPITLEIMAGQTTDVEDLQTNEFTRWFEELTGIKIIWNSIPVSGITEKVNILLSTGADLPDIFLNCTISLAQQIEYGANQKVFVDIKPYFKEYAPNILKVFEKNPITEQIITTPSGQIFGMGSFTEAYHVKYPVKMWVNQTWLDALNLEIPTTIDELTYTLERFKNDDPNRNGRQDEIALTASVNGWEQSLLPYMMSSFIDYSRFQGVDDTIAFQIIDGKLDFSFDDPKWKEGLLYLKTLYKKGLIDPLVFTQEQQQLKTTVNNENNLVGFVISGAPGGFTTGNAVRDKYVAVPPLVGSDGQVFVSYNPIGIGSAPGHFVITKECKNIEAAIRMLDYLMTDEGALNSTIGQKDRDWKFITDPIQLGINGKPAVYQRILKFHNQQNANWSKTSVVNYHDTLRNGMLAEEGDIESRLYVETQEKYEPLSDGTYLLPVTIIEDYNSEYVDLITPMQEYLAQFNAQVITGNISIDNPDGWNTHLETLENMQKDRLLDIFNQSYITQYGSVELWK